MFALELAYILSIEKKHRVLENWPSARASTLYASENVSAKLKRGLYNALNDFYKEYLFFFNIVEYLLFLAKNQINYNMSSKWGLLY